MPKTVGFRSGKGDNLNKIVVIFCQKKTDLQKLDFLGLTFRGRYRSN